MYKIRVGKRTIFGVPGALATEPVLTMSNNFAGVLTFKIPPDDYLYIQTNDDWDGNWWWKDKTALVEVLRDELIIWRGYIRRIEIDIDGTRTVTAEGVLSFLNDTVLWPFESDHPMNMKEWFDYIIEKHNNNSTISTFKKLKVGKITTNIPEGEDDLYRKIEGHQKTKDIIDGIVEKHGGYLYVTYEGADTFINYTLQHESEFNNAQTLRYGYNIVDLKFTYSTENLVNLLVPVGDDGITAEYENYPDYVENEVSQENYGVMAQVKQFDGIDDPAKLRKAGARYLEKNKDVRRDIEAIAIDMSAVNINTDIYRIGSLVRIKSLDHMLDEYMHITSIRLDLEHPEKGEYTLGNPPDDLYGHITKGQRLVEWGKDNGIIKEVPLQNKDKTYSGQFLVPREAIKKEGQWNEFIALDEKMENCPVNLSFKIQSKNATSSVSVRKLWGMKYWWQQGVYSVTYTSLQKAKNKIKELKSAVTPPQESLSMDDAALFAVAYGSGSAQKYKISNFPENESATLSYHGIPNNYDAISTIWYDKDVKAYEFRIEGYFDSSNPETSIFIRKSTQSFIVEYELLASTDKNAFKGATIGTQAVARNVNTLALGRYNARGSDNDAMVVGNGEKDKPKNSVVIKRDGNILAKDILLDQQKSVTGELANIKSTINSPFKKTNYMTLDAKPTFVAKADGMLNVYGRFSNDSGRMYLIIKEDGEGVAAYDTAGTPDAYFNITLPIIAGKEYTYLDHNVRLDQSYWMPTYFTKVT